MERPNFPPPFSKTSYIGRVIPSEELRDEVKSSKWIEKLFPVTSAGVRAYTSTDTNTSTRRSKRVAQRHTRSNSPLSALPPEIRGHILHYALVGLCSIFMRTWQEKDKLGQKYHVVDEQPADQAINEQAMYHLMSSPALPVFGIRIAYGVVNYGNIDLLIQDFRSGFTYLGNLPKNLQKVSFELSAAPQFNDHVSQVGCLRSTKFLKDELRRIGNTLVSALGALSVEKECSKWTLTVTSAAYRRAKNL
ncbi:hypothetical protein G6011_09280 [Alternaria panax]|uniref:Uncharacterized protein n=1 Tax=Alternaria panax TaxID=48097 RepID=A0AAD4IB11_9PLEO|nr:hypothetical protein G6011_09280 [Alternaria panax]